MTQRHDPIRDLCLYVGLACFALAAGILIGGIVGALVALVAYLL